MSGPIQQLRPFQEKFGAVVAEMNRLIVGQRSALETLLVAVFSGGHVLLTGVPGLGRTLVAKTLSRVLGLSDNRVQFTPDLLPSDILGSEFLEKNEDGQRRFRFFKGPIFTNVLLADEINRSPARTQSALLEAMVERQVTIGGQPHFLPNPFIVLATRNNMESDGVWRMPEAQIDRFMLGIEMRYLGEDDEIELLRRTTGEGEIECSSVLTAQDVLAMRKLAAAIPVVPSVKRFALDIVRLTRPEGAAANSPSHVIRMGASPRAAQSILRGAKVLALAHGRPYVTCSDIKAMAYPVLGHRLMLDFRAASSGVKVHDVITKLIQTAEMSRIPEDAYTFSARHVLNRIGLLAER